MKRLLTASAAAVIVLAVAVPAFAGGDHCSGGGKASATSADAKASCAGRATTTAWAGAWLQRSESGKVTVADVAKGSPAARSGLKTGDIVLAVNGYDPCDSHARAMCCAAKGACSVGSALTYKVQRGNSTKSIKLKLEKVPADAAERFASHKASFDPMLAAVVMPATTN